MLKIARSAMVPFVVLMAVSLVAGCGAGDAAKAPEAPKPVETAKPAETPKPADMPKPADTAPAAATPAVEPAPPATTPASEAPKPGDAAPASTPAAPATPGAALDAKTIVGTKWSAAGYTLDFKENGVIKINDDIEGTWKLEGTKLTIEAAGSSYEATVEGDKLMYEGAPLEKL
jgi:hypothetical protein